MNIIINAISLIYIWRLHSSLEIKSYFSIVVQHLYAMTERVLCMSQTLQCHVEAIMQMICDSFKTKHKTCMCNS